ncbi:MAG: hypothetical protein ABIR71_13595 [Chthoniobacterales bacterium]
MNVQRRTPNAARRTSENCGRAGAGVRRSAWDVGRWTFPLLFAAFALSAIAASPTPFPEPSSANSLFREQTFGPLPPPTATPAPKRIILEDKEPIPRSWWIGGIAAAVLFLAGILYGTARASRIANLFGRQFRFPKSENVALRFGGMRSGGHLATIRFGDGPPLSKTKDS